jgi:hypothetical protein
VQQSKNRTAVDKIIKTYREEFGLTGTSTEEAKRKVLLRIYSKAH